MEKSTRIIYKKPAKYLAGIDYSDFGRTRTLNPQSRNLMFYPVELRSQILQAKLEYKMLSRKFFFIISKL